MAEHNELPGLPKKRLVKQVRSKLWSYGIRPKGQPWIAAWSWAYAISQSYYRTSWPLASEIAAQYVLLLLAEMKRFRSLKLPYRAAKVIPDDVLALLPESSTKLISSDNINPLRIADDSSE